MTSSLTPSSKRWIWCFGFFLASSSGVAHGDSYPKISTGTTQDTYFGTVVKDPYRGLENGSSASVQKWVQSENQYADRYFASMPGRDKLSERLKALLYATTVFTPVERGSRLFYERQAPTQEKAVLYWRDRNKKDEHVVLDPNAWNPEEHSALGEWFPSPDGKKIVYLLKANNADEAVLCLLDVATGQESRQERIPGANFADPSWAGDSRGFYYMRLPPDTALSEGVRVAQADIRYHAVGSASANDPMIYPKTNNPQLYLTPSTSDDGHWLFISIMNGWSSNDLYVKDLRKKNSAFFPIFISTTSTAIGLESHDYFYLDTDEHSPNHRIVRFPVDHPDRASWTTVIPERLIAAVQDTRLVGNRIVLNTLKQAASQVEVWSFDGRLIRTLPLPGLGRVSTLSGNENQSTLYYQFESFTTAPEIYSVSLRHGNPERWAKTEIPVDASSYHVTQRWFNSLDGTPVSMFVVIRGTSAVPGPFLIQGYGGFDEPMLPRFDPTLFPWLESGGGYALVNLRGGGEYGETWHQAGMLTHKQNTLDDLAAAAQDLIKQGYTTSDRLAIEGASNGGLLTAAEITQHPGLFRAVICKVPLTDMLRYALVGEGAAWTSEYGSVSNPDEFRALLAYSPYHHVRSGVRYPSVLILSAENDDRVDPMHARKFAAALQQATASTHPIILRTESHAGHGGAGVTNARVIEWTERLLFLWHELGMQN